MDAPYGLAPWWWRVLMSHVYGATPVDETLI
jgi:hypothetical protein